MSTVFISVVLSTSPMVGLYIWQPQRGGSFHVSPAPHWLRGLQKSVYNDLQPLTPLLWQQSLDWLVENHWPWGFLVQPLVLAQVWWASSPEGLCHSLCTPWFSCWAYTLQWQLHPLAPPSSATDAACDPSIAHNICIAPTTPPTGPTLSTSVCPVEDNNNNNNNNNPSCLLISVTPAHPSPPPNQGHNMWACTDTTRYTSWCTWHYWEGVHR